MVAKAASITQQFLNNTPRAAALLQAMDQQPWPHITDSDSQPYKAASERV